MPTLAMAFNLPVNTQFYIEGRGNERFGRARSQLFFTGDTDPVKKTTLSNGHPIPTITQDQARQLFTTLVEEGRHRYNFVKQEGLDFLGLPQFVGNKGVPFDDFLAQNSGAAPGATNADGSQNANTSSYSPDDLKNSPEFKKLSEDDQAAVLAVFEAIATNDSKKAQQLIQNFEAAAKINDPYYAQRFRIAADTLKRGFISVDEDLEYNEQLQASRLADLRQDIESKKEFLTLEEQAMLKGIEREYSVQLEDTRQNLAATGKTSSSVRQEREQLLEETTGDLRESTTRRFGMQQLESERTLERGERDTSLEIERLRQLAADKKLDLFREGETLLGSDNLPELPGYDGQPLGDIYGDLPRQKLQDTLSSATSFTF